MDKPATKMTSNHISVNAQQVMGSNFGQYNEKYKPKIIQGKGQFALNSNCSVIRLGIVHVGL